MTKNEDLARKLNISVQSLELRIQRLTPLVGDVTKPETSKLTMLERVQAELLGLL